MPIYNNYNNSRKLEYIDNHTEEEAMVELLLAEDAFDLQSLPLTLPPILMGQSNDCNYDYYDVVYGSNDLVLQLQILLLL